MAHEVVIYTDNEDGYPVVKGLAIDGNEMLVPEGSEVRIGTGTGIMTATITLFANVRIEARPA